MKTMRMTAIVATLAILLDLVAACFGSLAQADGRAGVVAARGGLSGRAYGGRGFAGPGRHGGHGGRGHFDVGVWFGPGFYDPFFYQGYPFYPYYYPPYYYPGTTVVVPEEPEYVVPEVTQPEQPAYWYYCPDPKGYYPQVKTCPKGWLKVVPPTPPDATEDEPDEEE